MTGRHRRPPWWHIHWHTPIAVHGPYLGNRYGVVGWVASKCRCGSLRTVRRVLSDREYRLGDAR